MTAKNVKKTEDTAPLHERITELENNWKRALADYQNLEKRFADEKGNIIDFANMHLLSRLLSVLDNLDMMLAHNGDKTLEMIIKDFKNILREEKVEEVSALGESFNSNEMDALETVEGEDGIVMEVVRKGYKFKTRLLRPALVKVGKSASGDKKDS